MNYLKKLESLEERALIQVAINKCQDSDFRETVLCLEKPTYGDFAITPYERGEECLERWDRLVEEQCQKLTEGLPSTLKHDLQGWVHRIALEYLSYCRRQEALFGLSPYFLMDFVSRDDWNEYGRLDEERLAERLVEDERLTVLQRYRIACVYCLPLVSGNSSFFNLWKLLTLEERQSLRGKNCPNRPEENNRLVLFWSNRMIRRNANVTVQKAYALCYAMERAVNDGNRATLMRCWSHLSENISKILAMKMAFDAFYSWLSTQHDRALYRHCYKDWRTKLILGRSCGSQSNIGQLCLPFYFSDLLCFFLSEMSEAHQLTFFIIAFQDKLANYILECFLDWPHQNYFLPTVRKLWGILPKHNYARCLLILASKYSRHYDPNIPQTVLYTKEDNHYDYQSLLFQLWEETPEDYRRYIFTDKAPINHERYRRNLIDAVMGHLSYLRFTQTIPTLGRYWEVINEGQVFLLLLLSKCAIREANENFFKRVFNEATSSQKTKLIRSKSTWSLLAWKGNWHLLDWLFRECLAEEVSTFKKQYIESECGRKLCFRMLRGKREKLLEEFVDWIFESNEEKTEFKWRMVFGDSWFAGQLKSEKNVSEVERMIRFCLHSEEVSAVKKQYIESECGIRLCVVLLKGNLEKLLEELIDLVFESNEEKKEFKRKLIFEACLFGGLQGSEGNFSKVERVMRFCLDSEEFEQKYKEYVENSSHFDSLLLNFRLSC